MAKTFHITCIYLILVCLQFSGILYAQDPTLAQRKEKERAYELISHQKFDECFSFCEELLSRYQNNNSNNWIRIYALTYSAQSQIALGGKGDDSYNRLLEAQTLAENTQNDSALCSIHNGIGLYYLNVNGDEYGALYSFLTGIRIANICNHKKLYSLLALNTSLLLSLQKDMAGLNYAKDCYRYGKVNNDPYLISAGCIACARFYILQKRMKEATDYLKEVESLNNQYHLSLDQDILNTYGEMALESGDLDLAKTYYHKAEGFISKATILNTHTLLTYLGYGRVLIGKKEWREALHKLELGHNYSLESQSPLFRRELYLLLSECYDKLGVTKKALDTYKKYHQEGKEMMARDRKYAEKELLVKYESEKKVKDLAIANLKLKRESLKFLFMVVLVFFSIGFILFLILVNKRKNQLYRQIVKKNMESLDAHSIPKYSSSSLKDDDQISLFVAAEKMMKEDKVYKRQDFSREIFAEMLSTNRTYLSQSINQLTGLSFSQYVNKYRIQEALIVLSDSKDNTPIKALAADLGFNSITSFYTSFKDSVQMSPDNYRKISRTLESERIVQ